MNGRWGDLFVGREAADPDFVAGGIEVDRLAHAVLVVLLPGGLESPAGDREAPLFRPGGSQPARRAIRILRPGIGAGPGVAN